MRHTAFSSEYLYAVDGLCRYLQFCKVGPSISKRNCFRRVDVGNLRRVYRGSTSFQQEQAK